MEVIREIRQVTSGSITIPIPESLLHRKVEIIVLPLDERLTLVKADESDKGWPNEFCERFAGSCPDFPDIEPEGDYEDRNCRQ